MTNMSWNTLLLMLNGPRLIFKYSTVQIKMQVVMMADIIHGDGITLMDQMKSYSSEAVSISKYEWACGEPTHQDWKIWQKGL
jgi:hypothetical protein